MSDGWRLELLGDAALSVHAVEPSPLAANACVHRLARRLREGRRRGCARRRAGDARTGRACRSAALRRAAGGAGAAGHRRRSPDAATVGIVVDVPVVYGGEVRSGPGGRRAGVRPRRRTKCAGATRPSSMSSASSGSCPGFPYLGPLDPRLRLPRRATPRPKVPPGSVAIAGEYSGIYPWASPGGWHIIGRTDMSLFDLDATPPARLAPGTRVRFVRREAASR